MMTIIIFEAMNEKNVDLNPALGQNIAKTKMPTKGPESAPKTLMHT